MAVAADGTLINGQNDNTDNNSVDTGMATDDSAFVSTNRLNGSKDTFNTNSRIGMSSNEFSSTANNSAAANPNNLATEVPKKPGLMGYITSPDGRRVTLIFAAAVVVAIAAAFWMWSKKVEYKVLFSNFSDRDGGAIVAALSQLNVPYKYLEGGGAIMVPEELVYDTRLRLAAQGLPKGGNVGFELLENQKFGVSQFVEQVNFQRALEGELAQSIETMASVESARVHLALPKSSVFIRDQPKPSASIVLTLHPGRMLDEQQVNAIIHLVASSVPQLTPKNVTIVDQRGNLLSESFSGQPSQQMLQQLKQDKPVPGLAPQQIKYVHDLQNEIVKRVESILTPIVGPNNVRAEATVDVDFTVSEQAAEIYKPNQTPDSAAIRSQQTNEVRDTGAAAATNAGIPGALTNQPPAPAVAPIEDPLNQNAKADAANGTLKKEATINYEVDKTVRYTPQQMVGLKRMTVAVVVNHKPVIDEEGKVTMKPLTDEERTQVTELVKEAMGFNAERGDSVNVMNSLFTEPPKPAVWEQPEMVQMGMDLVKYVLLGLAFLFVYFAVIKPIVWKVSGKAEAEERARQAAAAAAAAADAQARAAFADLNGEDADAVVELSPEAAESLLRADYEKNLALARQLVKTDPKLAASLVTIWVGD
jgi:flagellar M-ring protein FliF